MALRAVVIAASGNSVASAVIRVLIVCPQNVYVIITYGYVYP
jgi:hypothetical protein